MLKETGIIMSGSHPRLILDGLKTMTRRTWGLEKINRDPDRYSLIESSGAFYYFRDNKFPEVLPVEIKCPYGQVGDLLRVKETWRTKQIGSSIWLVYKADGVEKALNRIDMKYLMSSKWRPSIFMPKDFARIWLEITGLRAERLNQITEEDAEAEGESWSGAGDGENYDVYSAVENYAHLWDSLNAKRGYGWETNPWVWVIGFKEVKQ